MAQDLQDDLGRQGDPGQLALVLATDELRALADVLALAVEGQLLGAEVEERGLVGLGVEDEDAVQGVGQLVAVHRQVGGEAVLVLVDEIAVVGEHVGLERQAEGLLAVARAQEEALVREADLDLVVGQPLADFKQILLGDEEAVLAQQTPDVGVGEAQQAELVAVEAADLHVVAFHGRELDAVHARQVLVVGDAEGDAVDDLLEEVARPQHGVLGRERVEILEPGGLVGRQLVFAAALLDVQVLGGRVELHGDLAGGQAAHQFAELLALHADQAAVADDGRIDAHELDARIRGQDGQGVTLGLEPDRAQIGGSGLGRDDVRGLEQPVDDVFLSHFQKHRRLLVS